MYSRPDRSNLVAFFLAVFFVLLTLLQCFRPLVGSASTALVTSNHLTLRTHIREEVSSRPADVSAITRLGHRDCSNESDWTPPRPDPEAALEVQIASVRRVMHRKVAPVSPDDSF